MITNVHAIMASLAQTRPVFHSEADFQHAFAWHVRQKMPDEQIRLEYKPLLKKRLYVDLWLPKMGLMVELKYRTRSLEMMHADELYHLRQQGAQDIGRYDFCKDIRRLEIIAEERKVRGVAILLTNEHLYWSQPRKLGKVDEAFHLHHGQSLSGSLSWSLEASSGTKRSREDSIELNGTYDLVWHDYGRVDNDQTSSSDSSKSNTLFRYLCVHVSNDA